MNLSLLASSFRLQPPAEASRSFLPEGVFGASAPAQQPGPGRAWLMNHKRPGRLPQRGFGNSREAVSLAKMKTMRLPSSGQQVPATLLFSGVQPVS